MAKKTEKQTYLLNKVEGFNPFDYVKESFDCYGDPVIGANGEQKKYLPTAAKIFWFRLLYPNGRFRITRIENGNPYVAIFNAEVFADKDDEHPISTWEYGVVASKDDAGSFTSSIQAAETVALGKALSRAGFGCEIEMMLDIDPDEPAPKEDKTEPKKRAKSSKKAEKVEVKDEAPAKEEPQQISDDEIADLMEAACEDAEVEEPKTEEKAEEEPKESPVDETPEANEEAKEESADESGMTLEEALATPIKASKNAGVKIANLEGKTLGEAIADYAGFEETLLRPNMAKQVTPEVVEAAKVIIAKNKK